METGKIKTVYVMVAAGIMFCIYGFSLLDALDFLHTNANPHDVAQKMGEKEDTLFNLNLGLFIMLGLTAGICYWRRGARLMFYVTAAYISFALAGYFYLEEAVFLYKKHHQLWEGGFSTTVIAAPILILLSNLLLLVYYLTLKALRKPFKRQRAALG